MILWFLTGLTGGFALMLVGGLFLPRQYFKLAMQTFGAGLLVVSSKGVSVRAATWNDEKNGWQIPSSSKTFEDPNDKMRRLFNKPFGIALDKPDGGGVIVNPADADLIQTFKSQLDQGDLEADGAWKKYLPIETGRKWVRPDWAWYGTQGSANARLPSVIEEYRRKSQSLFDSSRAVKYFIWLMMFGIGAGTPYALAQGSQSLPEDAGPSIQITIMDVIVGGLL
jgi:hypothetical protein